MRILDSEVDIDANKYNLFTTYRLYLYVLPRTYPFVLSQRNRNTYALHDAGLVMANISLAYESLGEEREWVLYDFDVHSFPEFPKDVLPVGKIQVS